MSLPPDLQPAESNPDAAPGARVVVWTMESHTEVVRAR
jgi:hypothetical protein